MQEAIFAEVANGSRHLVIDAGPGSGKTTTAVEAFSRSDVDRVCFAAFGRETKSTLESRLPSDIHVTTWNGYGARVLRKALGGLELSQFEAHTWAAQQVGKGKRNKPARDFVAKLLNAAKATLTDPAGLDMLADVWQIEAPNTHPRPELIGAAMRILEGQLAAPHNPITFDDQCWMPVVHDLPCWRYDLLGIDETQDLNPCQLELACRAGERIVAVGDPRQSIFAWRGADPRAMPNMVRRLEALTLPLLICYRCGMKIVAEAQRIYPDIQAAPGAHEGLVREGSYAELRASAVPGDFVVSRLNAPLIQLCLKWMGAGVRCRILGRDVAKGLINWVRGTGCRTVIALLDSVADYERKEIERLEALDRPIEPVVDRCEAVRAVSEGLETVSELCDKLESLFVADPQHGMITLASTHRAKGLEADRVWLLRNTYCRRWVWREEAIAEGLPIVAGGRDRVCVHDPGGAETEERNLLYVAITRAKRELVYVS